MSGKSSPTRALFLATLLLIAGLAGCRLKPPSPTFPIDLKQVIPEDWTPLSIEEADWDNDGDDEWLLFYRYNTLHKRGPIGGVIYDAQVDLQAKHGGLRLPTRPAFLIPYPLLPSSQAGAGYLGEKDVRVRGYNSDEDQSVDELAILGQAYDGKVAFLSLFRWRGTSDGYQLTAHFAGDGGIEVQGGEAPEKGEKLYKGRIETVIVKIRTHDRSLLCRREVYHRRPEDVDFARVGPAALDFTYGVPAYPAYPEGAVLAYYLAPRNSGQAQGYLLTEEEAQTFKEHAFYLTAFQDRIHSPGPHPRVIELAYKGETDLTPEFTGTVRIGSFAYEWADVSVAGVDDHDSWARTWLVVNVAVGQPRQSARWKLVGVYP